MTFPIFDHFWYKFDLFLSHWNQFCHDDLDSVDKFRLKKSIKSQFDHNISRHFALGQLVPLSLVLAGPISSDCNLLLTILSLRHSEGKIAIVCLQKMALCSIPKFQWHILKNWGRAKCKIGLWKTLGVFLLEALLEVGFELRSSLKTILWSSLLSLPAPAGNHYFLSAFLCGGESLWLD